MAARRSRCAAATLGWITAALLSVWPQGVERAAGPDDPAPRHAPVLAQRPTPRLARNAWAAPDAAAAVVLSSWHALAPPPGRWRFPGVRLVACRAPVAQLAGPVRQRLELPAQRPHRLDREHHTPARDSRRELGPCQRQATRGPIQQHHLQMHLATDMPPAMHRQLGADKPVMRPRDPDPLRQTPQNVCNLRRHRPAPARPTWPSAWPSPPARPATRSTSPPWTTWSATSKTPRPRVGSPRSCRPTSNRRSSWWTRWAICPCLVPTPTWSSNWSPAATSAARSS